MKNQARVRIYGVDHSPWVQTVLLTCHARRVPYQLVSSPSSILSYLRKGMIMPVCRWPDGSETSDSFEIMKEIDRRYPLATPPSSLPPSRQKDLERLFLSYALGRAGGLKSLSFLNEWSNMPSGQGAGPSSSVRAFMSLYFLVLIIAGRGVAKRRNADPDTLLTLEKLLLKWSACMTEGFVDGARPGPNDTALFGHVQCMTSGLTDDVIPILKANRQFFQWVTKMQKYFFGYPHDFSNRLHNRKQFPPRATFTDRAIFYSTLGSMALTFPITATLLSDAMIRRHKNPGRTRYPQKNELSL